jgi:hypothetical protein
MERRWGEITLTFVEVQIGSAVSVPHRAGRRPHRHPGRLRVRAPGLGRQRGDGPADLGRVVASLLGAAAKAQVKGTLADQLQAALDSGP